MLAITFMRMKVRFLFSFLPILNAFQSDQKLSMVVRAIYGSDSPKIYHIIKPALSQNDLPSWEDTGDYIANQDNPDSQITRLDGADIMIVVQIYYAIFACNKNSIPSEKY